MTTDTIQTLSPVSAAMLRARNESDLTAAAALQSAAKELRKHNEVDLGGIPLDPMLRRLYLTLAEAELRLRYEVICGSELEWYENNASVENLQSTNLSAELRRFSNELEFMQDEFFSIGKCEIPIAVYSVLPADRLTFVMLWQFAQACRENPLLNTIDMLVRSEDGTVHLELVFRHNPDADTKPMPAAPSPIPDSLPYSGAALTERFCTQFGIRMIRSTGKDRICVAFSFPEAEKPEYKPEVHSDTPVTATVANHVLSAYQVLLSGVLPTETLLMSTFRDG